MHVAGTSAVERAARVRAADPVRERTDRGRGHPWRHLGLGTCREVRFNIEVLYNKDVSLC